MGWSQLKNEDTYFSIATDWPGLYPGAGLPPFSITNPQNQTMFGWTYSRMGYKAEATTLADLNAKSVNAFRVCPTVYTYSFYYRNYGTNFPGSVLRDTGNVPTAKPSQHLKPLGLYYNKPKSFKKSKGYQFNTTLINYLQIGGAAGSPNNGEKWRSPILYMVTPLGDKSELLPDKVSEVLNPDQPYDTGTDSYDKKSDTFILPWPFFSSKSSLDSIQNDLPGGISGGRIFTIHYYSSPNEDVVSYLNDRPTIFYSNVLFGNSHTNTAYKNIITSTNLRKYEYKLNGDYRSVTDPFLPTVKYINDGEGIVSHSVNEIDWLIQGFSYVSLFRKANNVPTFIPKPWSLGGSLFGNGWYARQNLYLWYDTPKPNTTIWQDQVVNTTTPAGSTIQYTEKLYGYSTLNYILRNGPYRQQTSSNPSYDYTGCSSGHKLRNSFGWNLTANNLTVLLPSPVSFSVAKPITNTNAPIISLSSTPSGVGSSWVNSVSGRITPAAGTYKVTIKSITMNAPQGRLVEQGYPLGASNRPSEITLLSNTRNVKVKLYKNGTPQLDVFVSSLVSTPTDTISPLGKLTIPTSEWAFDIVANGTDYFEIKWVLDGNLTARSTRCGISFMFLSSLAPQIPAVMDVSLNAALSYKFELKETIITPAITVSSTPYKYVANEPYYNMPVGGPWSGGPNIDVPNWVDYYGYWSGDNDIRTKLSTHFENSGSSGLNGYSKSPHEGFRKNNYLAKYVNQDKFNMSFKYQNDRGDNTGLKFYLSDVLPTQKPINSHIESKLSNLVINDWATVVDTINVNSTANDDFLSNSKILREIKVTLDLKHTWNGDLVINLKGPRENDNQGFGKVINLFNREKGNSDNFTSTVFSSDNTKNSIYYGNPPFIGTYKMKKDIGVGYNRYRSNTKNIKDLLPIGGSNPGTVIGDWTLYIKDDAGLDTGLLTGWSIEFIFDNSTDIKYLGVLTQSTATQSHNFYGLQGNQYLIFVADQIASTVAGTYTVVKLGDLFIEESYHPQNNTLVTVGTNSITSEFYKNNNQYLYRPSGLKGKYFYESRVGVGNTLNATYSLTYSIVHTRAGTGRFTSGIWENGNWLNGWREDKKLYQFFDVSQFFSYNRDKKWRFTIIGPSYYTSQFNIGDQVSISNIVAIDINEERKIIKNYFTIINRTFNTLVVEFEFDFPIRRIQKDSEYHFINITKNIWLNGNFFNGYFKGIWTNGLFYGYPFITEMYDSHWIDGSFNGGHFKSNVVSLTFSSISYDNNNVVINFGSTHSFSTGDYIYINEFIDDRESVLFGDSMVSNVINNSSIKTTLISNNTTIKNISDIIPLTGNVYGIVKSNKNTALIQNINFESLNVSKVSSTKSLDDRTIFSFNSWMDTVFDETSATNIFRSQTNLNTLYSSSDVYYSNNNLYGYTTNDILSSNSTFRDSYSTSIRGYKLGTKYKIFHDYIGDSSYFDDYFTNTLTNPQTFKDLGWKYSTADLGDVDSSIQFERTVETTSDTLINGKELRVVAIKDGGVLNLADPADEIPNRYTEKIKQNRYTMVEFDLITKNIQEEFFLGDDISYGYNPYPMEQPMLHFGNLNLIFRKLLSPQSNSFVDSIIYPTYLPVYKNINHVFTPNKTKIEYFYNKRDLMMTFRGSGSSGNELSEYIIDNLKLYEVDMIPFFKYFTYENINRTVQIPIETKTPYKKTFDYAYKLITLSKVSNYVSSTPAESFTSVNNMSLNNAQPSSNIASS